MNNNFKMNNSTVSEDHFSVLDEIVTVSSLDDAVNPWVESGQEVDAVLKFTGGLGVSVEVGGFGREEVWSETLMGVEENSVYIVVELGWNILYQELDLIDEVSALGALSCWCLLGALVVWFDHLVDISRLNLGNVEAGSEGGGVSVWGMEKIVELGGGESGMFLIDLGEDNWGHADFALESSLLWGLVIGNLWADGGSQFGGVDESHDVRVVLENEDLLVQGGIVMGAWSNSNDWSSSDVWELDLKGKSVENFVGTIL